MYLYLYDYSLNNQKYNRLLAKIETRLTDLGIGGKIFRLSPLRNIEELLNDEIKGGIKTIIVVGNDKSFSQIVNFAAKFNVTLGLIPVGDDNKIAKTLGIRSPEDACNIIAARIIEKIDLGKINNTYFLSNITINGGDLTIECENKYKITPEQQNEISICNFKPLFATEMNQTDYFNPKDGTLEILVRPLNAGFSHFFKKASQLKNSIFPFKKLSIYSKDSISIITDGQKVIKTPVKIEIVPDKLKLIVGKDRLF